MTPDQPHAKASGGLAALFDAHRAELLRFLAARCGDADLAQDLAQDLWLKVSDLPVRPIDNGRAYLFRMANNLVLDHSRARMRAMRRDSAWIADSNEGPGPALPEDRPDPALAADEALALREEARALHRAIEGLPPGARQALRLARIEGLPQAEVAAIMGISRSGVEKHLVVAMKHLKIAMIDCGSPGAAASGAVKTSSGADPSADTRS